LGPQFWAEASAPETAIAPRAISHWARFLSQFMVEILSVEGLPSREA
jgi:hypothetical protein